MTANAGRESWTRCFDAGMDDFHNLKPIELQQTSLRHLPNGLCSDPIGCARTRDDLIPGVLQRWKQLK